MKIKLIATLILSITLFLAMKNPVSHPASLPTTFEEIPFDSPIPVYDLPAAQLLGMYAVHAPGNSHGSCATCHNYMKKAGYSDFPFPLGKREEFDQLISMQDPTNKVDVQPVGTPPTINLAWNQNGLTHGGLCIDGVNKDMDSKQFIDWKFQNLVRKKGVYLQVEVAFDAHTLKTITPVLREYDFLNDLALEAFNHNYITPESVSTSIGIFQQSFVTYNAPYQRYLRNEIQANDLKSEAGMNLFMDHCQSCHSSPALGFQKRAMKIGESDYQGLAEITKDSKDHGMLLVPGLYNLKWASGFGHNEDQSTLHQYIKKHPIHDANDKSIKLKGKDLREVRKFVEHDLYDKNVATRTVSKILDYNWNK